MILANAHILVVIYIQLLFSTSTAYTLGEFPSIRPVPCVNRMTGETGICTFNWSCINVAHGVHIGPCVDRFFVGSCCKTYNKFAGRKPSNPTSNSYGATETTKENTKVWSFSQSNVSTTRFPAKQKINTALPPKSNHSDIIHSYMHHEYNVRNNESSTKQSGDIDLALITSFSNSESQSQAPLLSLNRNPVLSYIRTTHPFGSYDSAIHIQNSDGQTKSVPIISGTMLTTDLPLERNHSTNTHFQQYHSTTFESPYKQTNISSYWNKFQQQNKSRYPDHSISLIPFVIYPSKKDPESNFDEKIDNHQISIVLDDSVKHTPQLEHQEVNVPSNTFFSWAYNFLSNRTSNRPTLEHTIFNTSLKVNISITSSSDISDSLNTSQYSVLEPQHAYSFTNNKSEPSYSTINNIDILTLYEYGNSQNISDEVQNFTEIQTFAEPMHPWSSPKPFAIKSSVSSTTEAVIIRNISKVCGRSRSNIMARIVGGRKSHYLRWPWMISLRRLEGSAFKHKCGAALLNQLWAITAAHCVDGKLPNDVLLRLGEYNLHRSDEFHPHIEKRIYMIIIHPEFDPATYESDLALLRFYNPVPLQANIVPVCLPKFTEDLAGRTAIVTGWGRLSEEGELPASLHEVQMPILTNKECEDMYSQAGYSETIRDVFVCAGFMSGGLDACEGDSGGPMVVKGDRGEWTLVGLISWGMGCAVPRQPGVYTRITKFVDWIDEIIESVMV